MPPKPDRKKRSVDGLPVRPTVQRISLPQAIDLTRRFRKSSPPSEKGGFFYAEHLRQLLEQPNCSGMRFYHGLDAKGQYRLVLVGVDADGRDITGRAATSAKALARGGEAVILDQHHPCPPWCADGPLS